MAFTSSNYRNWIAQGEPFDKGVEICKAHEISMALINLFSLGSNSYSRSKLREVLKGLSEKEPKGERQKVKVKSVRHSERSEESVGYLQRSNKQQTDSSATPQNDDIGQETYRQLLSKLHDELVILYKNQSNLHSKMKVSRRKDSRKKQAAQILALGKEIRELRARKKYIEIHGQQPPKTTLDIEDITDRAQLHQRLLNNRAYISKSIKISSRQKEVKRRQKENREIEKVLNS